MKTTTLYVASSSGVGGYAVTFDLDFPENGLIIECDCPAGSNNTMCKHRLLLIKGDSSIFDPDMYSKDCFPNEDWEMMCHIVKRFGLDTLVAKYEATLAELEKQKKQLAAKVRAEKKALQRKFSEGLQINKEHG